MRGFQMTGFELFSTNLLCMNHCNQQGSKNANPNLANPGRTNVSLRQR